VNGRKTNVASFQISIGDTITVRDKSKKSAYFKETADNIDEGRVPDWLSLDVKGLSGQVLGLPTREHIDVTLNEQLIVEYYSSR
jgi:small subunit ribosomal protein S4